MFDSNTGTPINSARVLELLRGNSVLTTATGTASLAFLPVGFSFVRVQKIGYQPVTIPIEIATDDTLPLTVVLDPMTMLPTVRSTSESEGYLSAGLQGFAKRMHEGIDGYFIDEKKLRKEDDRGLGNLLISNAPGVNIIATGRSMYLEKSPRCSDGGPPDVYLDGVLLARSVATHAPPRGQSQRPTMGSRGIGSQTAGVMPFDLTQIDTHQLAGVEYYPDGTTVPIEFGHTAEGCGALLLWTRER